MPSMSTYHLRREGFEGSCLHKHQKSFSLAFGLYCASSIMSVVYQTKKFTKRGKRLSLLGSSSSMVGGGGGPFPPLAYLHAYKHSHNKMYQAVPLCSYELVSECQLPKCQLPKMSTFQFFFFFLEFHQYLFSRIRCPIVFAYHGIW